ncbi:c-type cytochrome [Pseudorhodoferax sp. LjRoot39]|uniref:c-type cytochrome n=1 Tax=Pseudorhodoferax sp. LjRoot39 TaxID=3342328 RepID=UPI003ED1667A
MFRWRELAAALALLAAAAAAHAQPVERFPGLGRAATPAEVAAWDIDVRPDFQGLPKGAGSVAKGLEVWEAKCASCHGVFGESNEVFNPLVGGTTAEDIKTGRVANLRRTDYPGRTTLMKVATVSTLWDYINRAMPWNQPKSLSTEEVYAVTAFLLNLAGVVPDDHVLSDRNIAEVQQRMPNRNGMSTAHALWPGGGIAGTAAKPDVAAAACMKDCPVEGKVASSLPDFARNAHGNLAEQNRTVGAQRGAETGKAQGAAPAATGQTMPSELLAKNSCTACHAPDRKMIGPGWAEIATRHAGKGEYLAGKIQSGGSGVWGSMPMPPQQISADEAKTIADWLASGARR